MSRRARSNHRKLAALLTFTVAFLLSFGIDLQAGDLGFNLYGISYHLDRRDEFGKRFNEFNYGVGMNYTFYQHERSRYYLEAGAYHDSFRYTARYGALGYDYRLFDKLYFGLIAGLFDSRSVSATGLIVGAAPLLRYHTKWVTVNLVHLPEFPGINAYPAFATYLTIWLGELP